MAKQVARHGLAAKLGDAGRKAFEAHKNDETKVGNSGDVPAGVDGGIAQLTECKFDVYDDGDQKGDYYFYAAGVCHEPKQHAGLRTWINEPMYDTPTRSRPDVASHIAWVSNILRLLGIKTAEITIDDLEAMAELIKKKAPFFRFRTWKGDMQTTGKYANKEPMTNHDWGKTFDYVPADGSDAGVTGDATVAPMATGKPAVSKQAVAKPPTAATKASPPVKGVKAAAPAATALPDDFDALAALADGGDLPAGQKLKDLVEPFSIDWENAPSWADVVAQYQTASADDGTATTADAVEDTPHYAALAVLADGGDDAALTAMTEYAEAAGIDHGSLPTWAEVAALLYGTAAPEEEFVPEKGGMAFYTPKEGEPRIECEVLAVFPATKKANLKNMNNTKIQYKNVDWALLSAS